MTETGTLEVFRKKYKDEWILIRVLKTDKMNQPLYGKLIAHSKRRDDVYDTMKKVKGHTVIFFTGDVPKKGYAFCF